MLKPFEWLLSGFSVDLGIDLGTANTLVFIRDKGVVLDEPFSQPQFDRALGELVTTDLTHMQRAARRYAAEIDLHGMHARIADEVEQRYESGRAT